jgi:hypothetical protein
MSNWRFPRIALFLVASVAAAPLSSTAQAPAERGAFVMVQRGDTVAIERFARTSDSIAVDLVIKMQGRFVYVARTAKDFAIAQMTLQ